MSDYTPSTHQVRQKFAGSPCGDPECLACAAHEAEFDRWLAQIKADAWDEGHRRRWRRGPDECMCGAYYSGECACGLYGTGPLLSLNDNPYLKKEEPS